MAATAYIKATRGGMKRGVREIKKGMVDDPDHKRHGSGELGAGTQAGGGMAGVLGTAAQKRT